MTKDTMQDQKWDVIYADPPWKYKNNQSTSKRGAKPYREMSMDELKAMPISSIASPDCMLYMWATRPKMRECHELIDAWGFEYVTEPFTWVKLDPNADVKPVHDITTHN